MNGSMFDKTASRNSVTEKSANKLTNSKNLDEQLSKKIALFLLKAVSADDVKEVLDEHKELFNNPDNWRFNAKWGIAGNQQSNPVGAFTELVINSMDACLIKKAKKAGIKDLRGDNVPQSMQEAVKLFYPKIPDGRLENLDKEPRNKIADKSIFVGIKRAIHNTKYPTYTIVDFGEGQKPEDFKDTFVSVEDSKNNKEGIPFVQGKFHMGSTGVFRFLTQGKFERGRCKLIISKRFRNNKWGWTLVRLRKARENDKNESTPVVEYFSPDKNSVPYFEADNIQSLECKGIGSGALNILNKENRGVIEQGTIVKLYEFAMGNSNFSNKRGGLDNALTISLMRCALPIRIYDFIPKCDNLGDLGKEGIHKRVAFSGAVHYLHKNTTQFVNDFPVSILNTSDKELGRIDIHIYAVAEMALDKNTNTEKLRGLKSFYTEHPPHKCIFYTINGQVHATEKASVFNKIKFGELANYLIIEVVCDGIDKSQKHEIFLPNRESMSDAEISLILKEKVKEALKGHKKLKELDRVLKLKKIKSDIKSDNSSKLVFAHIVKYNPEIASLFGAGNDIDSGNGDMTQMKVFQLNLNVRTMQ